MINKREIGWPASLHPFGILRRLSSAVEYSGRSPSDSVANVITISSSTTVHAAAFLS